VICIILIKQHTSCHDPCQSARNLAGDESVAARTFLAGVSMVPDVPCSSECTLCGHPKTCRSKDPASLQLPTIRATT
jgi:hypothetical protein